MTILVGFTEDEVLDILSMIEETSTPGKGSFEAVRPLYDKMRTALYHFNPRKYDIYS